MIDGILKTAKTVLLGLLVLMVVTLVRREGKRVDFAMLTRDVTENLDLSQVREADARTLRRLYGLNGDEWENWLLYTAKDNMEVEELLLLEAKSGEQLDLAEEAAQRRAETQLQNFEGYAPEQVQMLEHRVLKKAGNYLLFAVGDEAESAREAFAKDIYQ